MTDERNLYVATKANRIAFIFLVIITFATIIIDGIKPITMRYYLFMSFLISAVVLTYYISYKILLRKH